MSIGFPLVICNSVVIAEQNVCPHSQYIFQLISSWMKIVFKFIEDLENLN
jgi:hypothetical protein